MKVDDFDMLATLLKQRSGLVITKDKAYLLESRLMPVARKWNLKTLDDLALAIKTQKNEQMIGDVVEAMTTNETSFMRDQKPFDYFTQLVLPKLLETRVAKKHIRIWSAACSSGQEAYSLAMLLTERAAQLQGWKIEIIGTDLSKEIVEKAKLGEYTQFEVQRGLPITFLVKYFDKVADRWKLKDNIRNMVQFREGNLLEPFANLGTFDVVFLRNVLIYFDPPTKAKVLEAMAPVLAPDGVLYLGGAETVLGITDRFKPLDGARGLYVTTAGTAQQVYKTA